MRPQFEKINTASESSLSARQFRVTQFDAPYHFHPEFELTFIVKSQGTRFVSENVTRFADNDLVLLGANLPHCWMNDPEYSAKRSQLHAESIVLQFNFDLLDRLFYKTPEAYKIIRLLDLSARGVSFPASLGKKLYPKLADCVKDQSMVRIISFMEVMIELANEPEIKLLSKAGNLLVANKMETERMSGIIDYLVKYCTREVTIAEIANVAHLAPTSFCRYFKLRTRKTFTAYLNELRVGKVCKLLTATSKPIGLISVDCGFNNYAHFHATFKRVTGFTPQEYRRQMTRLPIM